MRKRLTSILLSICGLITVGMGSFFILYNFNKNEDVTSFALNVREIAIGVEQKLNILADFYTIKPSGISVKPTLSSESDKIEVNGNSITAKHTGTFKVKFEIQGKKLFQDELTVLVKEKTDISACVKFGIESVNVYMDETLNLSSKLSISCGTNSIYSSNPIVSYSTDDICSFDCESKIIEPIKVGSTKIFVSLVSQFGYYLCDELEVNVLPKRTFSILTDVESISSAADATIIFDYSIRVGDEDFSDQSITLELLNTTELLKGKYINAPTIMFRISTKGTYILRIISCTKPELFKDITIIIS